MRALVAPGLSPKVTRGRVPQLMYMHWMNTMVGYCGPFKYESEYCQKLRSYLEANLAWMEEQMEKGQDTEYWHQVRMGNPHQGIPLGPPGPLTQNTAQGSKLSWPSSRWDDRDVVMLLPGMSRGDS